MKELYFEENCIYNTLIAIFFSIAAVPAYAEEYSSQTEYTKAKDFVANINFDFFFSSSDLGEDVIADLKTFKTTLHLTEIIRWMICAIWLSLQNKS